MARKQMMKYIEKEHKEKIEEINQDKDYSKELVTLTKIIIYIVLIALLVYILTGTFITKELFQSEAEEVVVDDTYEEPITINYDTILSNNVFKQSDEEYYVFIYDSSNEVTTSYFTTISGNYESTTDALNIYTVDLNDPFNDINAEEANANAQTASELAIAGSTVIKISNGQNVLYLEELSEITAHFAQDEE